MVLWRIQVLCFLAIFAAAKVQVADEKETAHAAEDHEAFKVTEKKETEDDETKTGHEVHSAAIETEEKEKVPGGTSPFIEPEKLNNMQLAFITLVYAIILYQSSNLISDGSELLLLVPSVAGLVGSIVLPILGAVPDGMMTLCSGLGPDAQEQVGAGVGVMSGSTVMLLTFPWFIAVMNGKVPLKDGKAAYSSNEKKVGLLGGGVTFGKDISKGAFVMILTTFLFLIIQVPAWRLDNIDEPTPEDTAKQAAEEAKYALIGLIACIVAFFAYLLFCYLQANEDKKLDAIIAGIKARQVSLSAALSFAKNQSESLGNKDALLAGPGKEEMTKLKKILKPFFSKYDNDNNGTLDKSEHNQLVKDLGLANSAADKLWSQLDQNSDGKLEFQEFADGLYKFMADPSNNLAAESESSGAQIPDYGIEDEEPEEMPEDIASLPPDQQQCKIISRSCWMMGLGTLMVVVFSDPLVDCLTELGSRLNVKSFYIAFILAPFASNASELLSAYNYAVKKTSSSITTSLSTLVGAACMNNTFCLAVMYALVYFKGLAWQFKAETLSIVLVQWVIGLSAIIMRTHTAFTAIFIIACYPLCLLFVQYLESESGPNLD